MLFQNFNPTEGQKENFKDLENLLQNCIREVKEIAYNLLPPELEKGFLNARERLAHRISSIGQIQFVIDIEDEIQEDDLNHVDKFNLYRIIQKLFNNSLKHAKATEFTIRVKKHNGGILIMAMDNGIGFEIDEVEKGLGIENIQYRMNMAGIEGRFESSKNQGTSVTIQLSSN